MGTIINGFFDWVTAAIASVVNVLPDSPFSITIPAHIAHIMGYVNYFIPIGQMVTFLVGWTSCIAVWYAFSLLLRWIKAIQ